MTIAIGPRGERTQHTQQIHHPFVVLSLEQVMHNEPKLRWEFNQPTAGHQSSSCRRKSTSFFGGEIALNAVYSSTDISTYGNWVVHYRYVSRLVISFYFWTEQFVYRFAFFRIQIRICAFYIPSIHIHIQL